MRLEYRGGGAVYNRPHIGKVEKGDVVDIPDEVAAVLVKTKDWRMVKAEKPDRREEKTFKGKDEVKEDDSV